MWGTASLPARERAARGQELGFLSIRVSTWSSQEGGSKGGAGFQRVSGFLGTRRRCSGGA